MYDIDRLWQLQQHISQYRAIKKRIKEISTKDNIKKIEDELSKMEGKLNELENSIKTNESILDKNDMLLKEYDYRLKKVEKRLYEENILDLKQLSILDKEREVLLKEIEEKETAILMKMEELEKLRKQFAETKKAYGRMKEAYQIAVEEQKNLIEDLNKKAEKELEDINEIASTMEEKLFQKFKELTDTKGVAVVEVVDNRCSGCNMVLPWLLLDKLKRKDEIAFCENCHRILYLKPDEKMGDKQ